MFSSHSWLPLTWSNVRSGVSTSLVCPGLFHGSELDTSSERLKTIYNIKIKKANKFISQNCKLCRINSINAVQKLKWGGGEEPMFHFLFARPLWKNNNPEDRMSCFVFAVDYFVNWEWERKNRGEAGKGRGKPFTIHLLALELWGQVNLAPSPTTPCQITSHG